MIFLNQSDIFDIPRSRIQSAVEDAYRILLSTRFHMPDRIHVHHKENTLLLILLVGLLMHAYVVRRLFGWAEQLLYHVPIIKSIYRAIRDFFDYFSPDKKKEFEQVVALPVQGRPAAHGVRDNAHDRGIPDRERRHRRRCDSRGEPAGSRQPGAGSGSRSRTARSRYRRAIHVDLHRGIRELRGPR